MWPFKQIYSKVKMLLCFGPACMDCQEPARSGEYYIVGTELVCSACLKMPCNNMLYYFLWDKGKLRDKDKPKEAKEWI